MRVWIERRLRDDCRCGFCHDAHLYCVACGALLGVKHDTAAIREAFPAHDCEDEKGKMMKDLLEILKAHSEEYDRDCSDHNGCSCGWTPDRAALAYDDERGVWPARDAYAEHLAAILRASRYERPRVLVQDPLTGEMKEL